MNTFKKISTLFALALISQSSFASATSTAFDTTSDGSDSVEPNFSSEMDIYVPENMHYAPNLQISAGDSAHIKESMQNLSQGAYAKNTANMVNNMHIADIAGSELANSMNMNTTAMNSNAGSSYNDSTNNLNTTNTDSSTNTYTSNTYTDTYDNSNNLTESTQSGV